MGGAGGGGEGSGPRVVALHGLAGAARAAEAAGDKTKAKTYYTKLLELTKTADTERPEIVKAKAFVAAN